MQHSPDEPDVNDARSSRDGLDVVVIGGYLGAGKTTLINHLLREASGQRIAVMVNDYGEIGIDADLILGQDGDVLQLAGGCICCSVGSDLVESLMALATRNPRPDRVLIETSGVALPGQVARGAALAPGLVIDGVVVMADAQAIRTQSADRHVGDTVRAQLGQADLLLLNKTEHETPEALEALQTWLVNLAPRARIIPCSEAQVPAELVLGLRPNAPNASRASNFSNTSVSSSADRPAPLARRAALARASRGQRPAASIFDSLSLELPDPCDVNQLAILLADPALGLVRVKGWVPDRQGRWHLLQMVGERWRCTPASVDQSAPDAGRLMLIGLRDRLDPLRIDAILKRCVS